MKLSSLFRRYPSLALRRYIKAHHISRAALVMTGIAAALVFFAIGAGVRLLLGPVSLGPFTGTLGTALNKALPGISVKYDQAAIEWERDEGRVNLVILGTRVFDSSGRIIAQAPKADIDLAAGPFLRGKVVVKRIALVGVQLTLVRTAQGALRLGIERDKQEHDILSRISDAIRSSHGSTSALESFAVRNARLAFYDEASHLFLVAPRADFRLAQAAGNLVARVDAAVEISGRPAHVVGELRMPPKTQEVDGDLSITGFQVAALAANSKAFAALKQTALKLDLSGSFKARGTHLLSADFGVLARGTFEIPGVKDGRVRVTSLRTVGRYDGATQRLLIEDAAVASDRINGRLQGWFDFADTPGGALQSVRAELQMDRLSLALPTVFATPVQFQVVDFRGAWLPATQDIVIDHLGVSGAPLAMQASGKITLASGQTPAISLNATMAPMNVRDLVRYWPLIAARGGRDWAEENMPAGTVGPTTLEMHVPAGMLDGPLPPDALAVKFAVTNGEINYIKGLTHLTQVQGTAGISGTSFTADISSAKVGPLSFSGGHFVIPDLNAADQTGDITAHVQGAMSDVLALVDMPPLQYPTRFHINAADSKGTANLDLSVHVPMRKSVSVDEVKIDIKAAVTGFGIALGPHTRLTDGNVAFVINNDKLHATGSVGVGGSASRLGLDWSEDFKAVKPTTTKVTVKGTLDEQARTALGLHAEDYIKGPVGISGTLNGRRGALSQANLTFDLTPAVLTMDMIGVNKPAGFPMTARADIAFGPHSTLASQAIRVTGPGTSVTANARYDANEHLVALHAPVVRIGPQDDFTFDLTRTGAGVDISVRGRSLDGSRLAHGGNNDDEKFDEPFHINAKLDHLVLRDGVTLSPFSLDVSGIADRPALLALTASLSKTATVTASITPNGTGRQMTLATNDMGLLTRGLFGFNSMRGGKFEFSAKFPERADQPSPSDKNTPDFQGKMTLKDFRIVNQPFLARVFSAGSLGGLINLMQGQGIAVDTLEVPFSSRNGVISVHDAHATGPAIGISGDGYIDRPKNDIALKGSLVPLYTLNSVLGNIPILGDVLTSKQGEGIFGMSYSVSGDADEPSVSINPLSVLAPGILRRIFEGRIPNAAQAPSNRPAAPAPEPKPAAPAPEPKPAAPATPGH